MSLTPEPLTPTLILVAGLWLAGCIQSLRCSPEPTDSLTVTDLAAQRDAQIRCDSVPTSALQPLPEHLSRPAAWLYQRWHIPVCLSLPLFCSCRGSVAGSGCRGEGGVIYKRADTDENMELGPSVDPLELLTHLLCSRASAVQHPALSRFNSLQVFFSSDHNSSWFL